MTDIWVDVIIIGSFFIGIGACIAALCVRRKAGTAYNLLDKISIITNCALTALYGVVSWYGLVFCALITDPAREWLAWMLLLTYFPCLLGLAASVFLRKRGRRILGFLAQFLGIVYVLLILAIAAIV